MQCISECVAVEWIAAVIGQVITWALVLGGWAYVDRANNQRETRKELRSIIDDLQQFLNELETNAVTYHTSVNSNADLAATIRRSLYRVLTSKVNLLKERGIDVYALAYPVQSLRSAITLNNFDTKSFVPLSLSDNIVRDIGVAKDDLSDSLELEYFKTSR